MRPSSRPRGYYGNPPPSASSSDTKPIRALPSPSTKEEAERHRRTYYASAGDDDAAQAICQKYGLSNPGEAVRLALRLVASADGIQVKCAPAPTRRIVLKLKAERR